MKNHNTTAITRKKNKYQHHLNHHGFCVDAGSFSVDECQQTILIANEILRKQIKNPQVISFDSLSTDHHAHDYFLESARNIHVFYEPDIHTVTNPSMGDRFKLANKLGHGLHLYHPHFQALSKKLCAFLKKQKIMKTPRTVCSQIIFKRPGHGGEILPHQDGAYIHTTPLSTLTLWIPLEKTTLENGCLFVESFQNNNDHNPQDHASQKNSANHDIMAKPPLPLRERHFLNNREFDMELLDKNVDFNNLHTYEPLLLNAGDLVLLHATCPHFSKKNKSDDSRIAAVFNMVDLGTSNYSKDNWIPLE